MFYYFYKAFICRGIWHILTYNVTENSGSCTNHSPIPYMMENKPLSSISLTMTPDSHPDGTLPLLLSPSLETHAQSGFSQPPLSLNRTGGPATMGHANASFCSCNHTPLYTQLYATYMLVYCKR